LRDLRVLVVDDNETNRKILHHQIASWGMKTGSAEDGPNAIKMLCEAANRSESYDVAILDMQMPDMDGLELAHKTKEEPSIATTKLIMMSSVGGRDVGAEARQVGIEVYLTKPVRQSRLYDAIATAMDTPTEGAPAPSVVDTPPIDTPLVATSALHKPKERPRILIAEDNAVNQKVAAKMLEMLGYRADVAANGLEAIEALSRITYAAVLMDVQMPEMDGYEATAEVRRREEKKDRRTPIIAMTANAMQGDRERALEAGMDDYVPKPVKREELEMIMQRWLPGEGAGATITEGSGELPAATEATEGPLDREVIESLRELGGSEMLSELGQMYLDNARSGLATLQKALEEGDASTVQRVAHTLRGSSSNMGAKRMASLLAKLQDGGAYQIISDGPELLERLEAEFERVRPALEVECS
jgi:CheY-like chemotaxis protein